MVRCVLVLLITVVGVYSRGLPEEGVDVTNVHWGRSGHAADDIDCEDCQREDNGLRSEETTKIRTHRVSESSNVDKEEASRHGNRRGRGNSRSRSLKGSDKRLPQRKRPRNRNHKGSAKHRKGPFLIAGGVRVKVTSSKAVEEDIDHKFASPEGFSARSKVVDDKQEQKSALSDSDVDLSKSGFTVEEFVGNKKVKDAKVAAVNLPEDKTESAIKAIKEAKRASKKENLETTDNVKEVGEKILKALHPGSKKVKQNNDGHISNEKLKDKKATVNNKKKSKLRLSESVESEEKVKAAVKTKKVKRKNKDKAKNHSQAEEVQAKKSKEKIKHAAKTKKFTGKKKVKAKDQLKSGELEATRPENLEAKEKENAAAKRNKDTGGKKVKARDQLPVEDVETNRPDDDRWSRRGFKQVPDVARLEQRLHPRVNKPVRDIIHILGQMLHRLQSSIGRVDHHYHYIFNTTRYNLMLGVRQKLMDLSKENNKVYDIVMDASLLTKQIYRRAHEQRTNGHYPLRLVANDMEAVNHLNLRQYHVAVREEFHKAQLLRDLVNRQLRHRDRLRSKYMEVERRVRERLPTRAMLDIIRRANQTILALQNTLRFSEIMNGAHLREHARNDSTQGMRSSWILIRDSKHVLKEARDLSMVNRRLTEEVIKRRSGTRSTTSIGSPFDDTRMMLWVKVDEASLHADQLLDEAAVFMRMLKPLTKRANDDTLGQTRSQGEVIKPILENLKSQIQNLTTTLNDIRLYFGIEIPVEIPIVDTGEEPDELPYSGDGSGDGEIETIIDIDGSGDIDEDIIDIFLKNGTSAELDEPAANTTIDKNDDEDLSEENFIEVKTKEPKTTTIAPTTTTEKEKDSEDDGFEFTDLFGFFNDEPVKDDTITFSEDIITSINASLNELIRKELLNYSQDSKKLSEPANKAMATAEELSHTLVKLKKRLDTVEGRVGSIQSFGNRWGAKRAEYTALSDRVQDVSRDIDLKVPIIEKQSNEAVAKATNKRDRMQKSLENQGPSVGDTPDPQDVKEVKATIAKVEENIQELNKLRQVAANPCEAIQKFDFSFRTNISELRKKVERAKLIAASLPISVSVKDGAHISVPLAPVLLPGSPVQTSIQAAVRPTETDGPVLTVKTNDTGSVMVVMEGLFPTLAVLDKYEYTIETATATEPLNPGSWYTFIVDRLANTYNLTVLGISTNAMVANASITDDDISPSQGQPSTLYLGGVTSDFPEFGSRSWDGCVGDVEVNGHQFPVLTKDSKGQYPTGCTSIHHITRKTDSWLFDGTGHAHFSLDHVFRTRRLDSVEMTFIPQTDGVIMSLQSESMRTRMLVQVTDGTLSIQVKHHRNVINKVSTRPVHGLKQTLEVRFVRGMPELVSDGTDFKTLDPEESISYSSKHRGLYVGGFGDSNSSFQGCIHSLLINKKQVPFENIISGSGVHLGHCEETTCVTFSESSQAVQFEDVEDGSSVMITFTYGSLGPLLEYSRGKKFKVTVSITTSGLEMSESVTEEETDIDLDDLEPGDLVVLLIRDDREEKTIRFQAANTEETIEYGSDSGWNPPIWGSNDKESKEDKDTDGPYSLTIGTSSDVDDILDGTVRGLAIGERLFNKQLMTKANSLSLDTCVLEKNSVPSTKETTMKIETRNVC